MLVSCVKDFNTWFQMLIFCFVPSPPPYAVEDACISASSPLYSGGDALVKEIDVTYTTSISEVKNFNTWYQVLKFTTMACIPRYSGVHAETKAS